MKSNLIFGFLMLWLLFVSCQNNESNFLISPNMEPILVRTVDPDSLTAQQIYLLEHYIGVMMDSSNSVVIKIANSSYSNSQIDTLSESTILSLFDPSEIDPILDSITVAGAYIDQILGEESCVSCAYSNSQRLNTLQDMALSYRDDPEEFMLSTDPKKKRKLFSDGPGCNLEFYVCLGLCSASTGGIMAAGCVYLCACAYCEYTPPGCG